MVTSPAGALSGRFTLALLQRVRRPDLIASSLVQLPALAVRVGTGAASGTFDFQRAARQQLASATMMALENKAAIHEWSTFLLRVSASAGAQAV